MPEDITKKILSKIKEEKIKPTPKWYFILRNSIFWFLVIFMTILGALSCALIFFSIFNLDWDLPIHLKVTPFFFFLKAIPHLWISLLAIFILIGIITFKKTKKGFLYQPLFIIGLIVPVSLFLGAFLYWFGLGDQMEYFLNTNLPYYRELNFNQRGYWNHPNLGLLGGRIVEIESDSIFILIDFDDEIWEVRLEPETQISERIELESGEAVKVIGEQVGINSFKAIDIRPWSKRGIKMPPRPEPSLMIITPSSESPEPTELPEPSESHESPDDYHDQAESFESLETQEIEN